MKSILTFFNSYAVKDRGKLLSNLFNRTSLCLTPALNHLCFSNEGKVFPHHFLPSFLKAVQKILISLDDLRHTLVGWNFGVLKEMEDGKLKFISS